MQPVLTIYVTKFQRLLEYGHEWMQLRMRQVTNLSSHLMGSKGV
jgi:hypothetical protein